MCRTNIIYELEKEFEHSFLGPIHNEGVYVIVVIPCIDMRLCKDKARIMYVGSSQKISKRVNSMSHPYYRLYNKFVNDAVICYYKHTLNYKSEEVLAIKKYQPELNIHHNG